MKRGVWFGGALMTVGGWLGGVAAQAPVEPLIPVALSEGELSPVPIATTVSIGRPIPIASTRSSPGGELAPVSHETPARPDMAPVPGQAVPPPLPTWPEDTNAALDNPALIEEVSLFASDRPAPRKKPAQSPDLIAASNPGAVPDQPLPLRQLPPSTTPAPLPPAVVPPSAVAPHGPVYAVDGPVPDPLSCHLFGRVEYLLWGIKSFQVPALITTGNADPAHAGILGQPDTKVLFGDSGIDGGLRSGLRAEVGWWFDMWCEEGVEVGGFFLGDKISRFTANSNEFPVISRPFFDLNNNRQAIQSVAFPGVSTGSATVTAPSRLFGFEANYLHKLCCGCDYRADLLVGFRYLNLDESLTVNEDIQAGPAAPAPFTNQHILVSDRFQTRNQFYGAQVGVSGDKQWGQWYVEGKALVALGAEYEQIDIVGSEHLTPNPPAHQAPGGLLALGSNSGRFSKTRLSVLPEINLNLGYQVNDHLRVFVGYDLLYLNSVVRPGDQIDQVLDIATIPNFAPGTTPTGQGRPSVPFRERDFWAQGVNIGFELRY
jgi:hypothetical protein